MAQLPVIEFIQQRLAESDVTLETRQGTGFYDLFIKPQQLMLQPLFSAMDTVLTSQSVNRVLNLDSPDSFDETLVDDLVGNVYISRNSGAQASTIVRVYYEEPVEREFPALSAEFTSGSLSFFNTADILITKEQMTIQQDGTLYYMDVPVAAQAEGTEYNVDAGSITDFVNDSTAISVTNLTKAVGGLDRETNTQVLARARNSIGVRDLETIKGINAILLENFPYLQEIQAIGMGDPEMMRDVLYNVHVGGATDVYLKTPELQILSKDVIGLVFDTTRELDRNVHMQLLATSFSDVASELNTPNIVSATVKVRDDVVETSARFVSADIPAGTGINLVGKEWIKVSVDGSPFVNIKISGATPSASQRFEIINAINATLGILVASPLGTKQIAITSPSVGAKSKIIFAKPDTPRTDGTSTLFPVTVTEGYTGTNTVTFAGDIAVEYLENIDYAVNYADGKIIRLPGSDIMSGTVIAASPSSGFGIVQVSTNNLFQTAVEGAFSKVRVGDSVEIVSATGVTTGTYLVQTKIDDETIRLLGLVPSADDASVSYFIVSNQTLEITYKYNPLSVDIGNLVKLGDGLERGIRPGREGYTITDTAFIAISKIEEIDPETGELIGVALNPPGGFGTGGFGLGGFGNTTGNQYQVLVLDPVSRYSAFEDSLIVFDPSLFGKSYRISYHAAPQIADIHAFCRNDLQRVTGADVLPKNFIPAFVDMTVTVRRDANNLATPNNTELAALVTALIQRTTAGTGLKASDIIKVLEDAGVDSVQTPFTMTAKVINTDGSTTIHSSEDILQVPALQLPRLTDNYGSPRITHFYPLNVVVEG